MIEEKKSEYDYIVIDTAAGTHCPVIAALEMCDVVYAVTEPTPLGCHDLELILNLLKRLKIEANIVLNRSDIGDKKIIQDLAEKFDSGITAEIPYSKEIVKQYSRGEPVTNSDITKIAHGLIKK